MGSQQGLDAIGLGVGQVRPEPTGRPVALAGQRVEAAVEVGGPPVADGLAVDAEDVGQVGLGEAQLAAVQAPRRRTSRASSDNCRASGKERATRRRPPSSAFKCHQGISEHPSCRRNIILVDLRTGKEIRRFESQEGTIAALSFSPDRRQLAAGGAGVARSCPTPWWARSTPACRRSPASWDRWGPATSPTSPTSRWRCSARASWRGDELIDAASALADAGVERARLGPRDGLAFMSGNAVTIGRAALLVVDARRLLDAWLSVAALSFEAAAADPVVLDSRIHSSAPPGPGRGGRRMRELLDGPGGARTRDPGRWASSTLPVPRPAAGRRGVHDALLALEETVGHELNFAGENALVIAGDDVALPNGNPHAAPLANAIDGLRTALAQSAALIAARVSTLLDASLTGLPLFLARRPGPESGALVLEYTAHAAVAEVRSLVTPVAAQTVSVSRGVESHSSLAPIAARRAHETLSALRVVVATELVVAVRALSLAGHEPSAPAPGRVAAASQRLDPDLRDRPLHPDVEAARQLIEALGGRARLSARPPAPRDGGYIDAREHSPTTQVVPDRRRRLLILGICSMSLLIVGLDTTIVNVALPAIHRSFHAASRACSGRSTPTRWCWPAC